MSWGKLCPLLMAAAWCYIIPCIFSAASWQRCMAAVAAPRVGHWLASRAPLIQKAQATTCLGVMLVVVSSA